MKGMQMLYGDYRGTQRPIFAYHPALLGSTPQREEQRLRVMHYSRHGGRYLMMKLWGNWCGGTAIFSLRRLHPLSEEIPGTVVMQGDIHCTELEFTHFRREIEARGNVALTLLDDEGKARIDECCYLMDKFLLQEDAR
jgi:hypothetical protein